MFDMSKEEQKKPTGARRAAVVDSPPHVCRPRAIFAPHTRGLNSRRNCSAHLRPTVDRSVRSLAALGKSVPNALLYVP